MGSALSRKIKPVRDAGSTTAKRTQNPYRHQLGIPRHAHVRVAVSGLSPDSTRHVRPMPLTWRIHRIAIVGDSVCTVNIIHITVEIVVQSVIWHLILIDPHLFH